MFIQFVFKGKCSTFAVLASQMRENRLLFLRFTALKMSFAPVVGENEPLKDVMEALMDIFSTVF